MKYKTIKLSETQYKTIINEDYPFTYLGTQSSETNHGSEVSTEGPDVVDSSEFKPLPTTGDKVAQSLTNRTWWNRGYGKKI